MSYVYFLYFRELEAYKIGKTNNIESRLSDLTRSWGGVCGNASKMLKMPNDETAFKVETFLHKVLNKYKYTPDEQLDGFTEFFTPKEKQLLEAIEYAKNIFGEVLDVAFIYGDDRGKAKITRFKENPLQLYERGDDDNERGVKIITTTRLNEADYINAIVKNIKKVFSLHSAAAKSLKIIVWLIRTSKIHGDMVLVDSITLAEFNESNKQTVSRATLLRGLAELEKAKIVAKAARRGYYYINPTFAFNSDKIEFITSFRR